MASIKIDVSTHNVINCTTKFLRDKGYTVIDLDNLQAGFIKKFSMPYTYDSSGDEVVLDQDFFTWAKRQTDFIQITVRKFAVKENANQDLFTKANILIDSELCIYDGKACIVTDYADNGHQVFIKFFGDDCGTWVNTDLVRFFD